MAEKFRGCTEDGLTGTRTQLQRASEFTELIEPRIKELTEKGETTFESAYVRGDKSLVPVEIHSRLFMLGGKKLILSAVRDITDRKKTEEELRQSSEKLQRAMDGTIHSMSATAEVRDPYTAGHQQRESKLAVAIAKEMCLPAQQVEGIRVAGTLHDIGKIYVPAEILSKPGHLRKNEFNLIKDHSEVGYDLLKDIEFPWPVAQIVLQHHERMDGSGYPQGISGDSIMIEARIMAVADVVESMASHRPYRPAFSTEKALLEIIQKKSILYAPEVVDACVRLFNDKGFAF
ncbi:MAG: HD domain-containing phosphohydrolase [Planctomycetota bacterium]